MASRPEPLTSSQIRLVSSACELAARGELALDRPERIAANASMPAGAVRVHFGDEAAFLAGLLRWCADQWSQQGAEIRSRFDLSLTELLATHWRAWTAEKANPRLLLLFVGRATLAPPPLARLVESYRTRLHENTSRLLGDFQRQGSIAQHIDTDAAAELLVRTWLGVAAGAALDRAIDITTAFDDALRTLVASWRPHTPGS